MEILSTKEEKTPLGLSGRFRGLFRILICLSGVKLYHRVTIIQAKFRLILF